MKAHRAVLLSITALVIISLWFLPLPGSVAAESQSPGTNQEATAGVDQVQPYTTFLPSVRNKTGNIYYIAPNGNDHSSGTLEAPWRTFDKAASEVKPGDTVFVRGGIYHESAKFTTSGTSTLPIKILAFPPEKPIIDGYGTIPGEGSALFSLKGDYIYASGIEVRNSAYDGVQLLGNFDIVSDMFIHHCLKKGILISEGHNSVVEHNLIWWNSTANEYGNGSSWSSGITAGRNGVSYATIRDNAVWENWGQGINTYEADHTVIEGNVVHDNFSGNIYIHDAINILCQRNFIYTNPASIMFPYGGHYGIMMGDERTVPSTNITIINNISFGNEWNYTMTQGTNVISNVLIANNTFVNGITNGGVRFKGNHQNIRFANNLVQQDGPLPLIVIEEGFTISFSHNLWSKTPPQKAMGPGDIIANPLLAQTGDQYSPDWFKLTGLSPAISNALALPEVIVDYFGYERGAPPDIGADEFFPTP